MGQFLSDDFRRVDPDALQQLPDRRKHPRNLSSRYPDRNLPTSWQAGREPRGVSGPIEDLADGGASDCTVVG